MTAQSFINWIQSVDEEIHYCAKEVLFLNKIQIYKRLRVLEKQELKEVLRIAEDIEMDATFRFAAYILLENKIGADIQFDLLSNENQKELKNFPIWNLYKILK